MDSKTMSRLMRKKMRKKKTEKMMKMMTTKKNLNSHPKMMNPMQKKQTNQKWKSKESFKAKQTTM